MHDITGKIRQYIEDEVNRRCAEYDANRQWKIKYEDLVSQIEQMHYDAKLLYTNMQEEGLTAGTIEAEGYLRATKSLVNVLSNQDEYL